MAFSLAVLIDLICKGKRCALPYYSKDPGGVSYLQGSLHVGLVAPEASSKRR